MGSGRETEGWSTAMCPVSAPNPRVLKRSLHCSLEGKRACQMRHFKRERQVLATRMPGQLGREWPGTRIMPWTELV